MFKKWELTRVLYFSTDFSFIVILGNLVSIIVHSSDGNSGWWLVKLDREIKKNCWSYLLYFLFKYRLKWLWHAEKPKDFQGLAEMQWICALSAGHFTHITILSIFTNVINFPYVHHLYTFHRNPKTPMLNSVLSWALLVKENT